MVRRIRRKPRYFFAVFGDPSTGKPSVEDGYYPHEPGYIPNLNMTAGDVVLLHCAERYLMHPKEAPGIGVVTGTEASEEGEEFDYQYFPLDSAVDWDTIRASIPELRFPLNYIGNWLQVISSASFQRALTGKHVDWP